MKKIVILYTMDGCSHCTNMKKMLKESDIIYTEHNIKNYEKEYEQFVKETKNEYLPAFSLIEILKDKDIDYSKDVKVKFLTPDDSFDDLNEAVVKVKEFLL